MMMVAASDSIGKERKAKPQGQQMMDHEADKCQIHEPGQRQALELPLVHDQDNQAELHDDCRKRCQFPSVLSKRASLSRRPLFDCNPHFTAAVKSWSFNHNVNVFVIAAVMFRLPQLPRFSRHKELWPG